MVETTQQHAWSQGERDWPEEVRFILSMVQGDDSHDKEKRRQERFDYRVKAALELEDPTGIVQTVPIFTRDVNSAGLGFIVSKGLKPGSRGRLIRAGCPDAQRSITCELVRCRPIIEGWYEGAVLFDSNQPSFEP